MGTPGFEDGIYYTIFILYLYYTYIIFILLYHIIFILFYHIIILLYLNLNLNFKLIRHGLIHLVSGV
jgi:hypothetical protein